MTAILVPIPMSMAIVTLVFQQIPVQMITAPMHITPVKKTKMKIKPVPMAERQIKALMGKCEYEKYYASVAIRQELMTH